MGQLWTLESQVRCEGTSSVHLRNRTSSIRRWWSIITLRSFQESQRLNRNNRRLCTQPKTVSLMRALYLCSGSTPSSMRPRLTIQQWMVMILFRSQLQLKAWRLSVVGWESTSRQLWVKVQAWMESYKSHPSLNSPQPQCSTISHTRVQTGVIQTRNLNHPDPPR